MNKYQKALDYLVSDGTYKTLYSWGDEIEVETEHGEDSLNLLQELVDKEKPMKPLRVNEEWDTIFGEVVHESKCPKCNCMLLGRGTRCFYEDCGQRIDWSSENE